MMPHVVVRNDADQYSTWAMTRRPPDGWHIVDNAPQGDVEVCLTWIESHWTSILPRPIRTHETNVPIR